MTARSGTVSGVSRARPQSRAIRRLTAASQPTGLWPRAGPPQAPRAPQVSRATLQRALMRPWPARRPRPATPAPRER
eukprot:8268112-Alexandrium_andersonii.AAC.1